MTVIDELLAWSETRPAWQRDALRRIVTQPELSANDLNDLSQLCKAAHGLATDVPDARPLAQSHVASPGAPLEAISLRGVRHIAEVNALAPDQTLQLGETGLTVIYGDNASGKSGYTRILKSACRARGAQEAVLTNVLSQQVPGRPTAEITYACGSRQESFTWTPEATSPPELSRVSVFDTHSASVYVSEKTDVAFRPHGLDIFDRLAAATDRVRQIVDSERKLLEGQAPGLPDVGARTRAYNFLKALSSLTTDAEVDEASLMEPADVERLSALTVEFENAQPASMRAKKLRAQARRIASLRDRLRALVTLLGPTTEKDVAALRENANAATEAVRAAKKELDEDFLPGTGSSEWIQLWAAAGVFSKVAYPVHSFPRAELDSQCVLCQQPISEVGRTKLQRLASYADSQPLVVEKAARARLQAKEGQLTAADTSMGEEVANLGLEKPKLAERVSGFLETVSQRAKDLIAGTKAQSLPTSEPLEQELEALVQTLDAAAATAESATAPEQRDELRRELAELQSRQALAKNRASILSEIRRRREIAAYQMCLKDLTTNAITKKSSELTKKTVTEALADAFQQELKALRFNHVEVQLEAVSGTKGSLYHQIRLVRAAHVDLPKVISEGESRCLALAGFLAELAVASEQSGILFDDPVSSLDHMWRDNVAERLTLEAQRRQVVVFTHDVVFLTTLQKLAEELGTKWTSACLRRDAHGPGVIESALPWVALGVSRRIGALKQMLQQAEKANRKFGAAIYQAQAKAIYGLLREAWERAIEEVLLNGAVERFRRSIETKRVQKLTDISDADYEIVERNMSKCSTWCHDQPAAVNSPIPPPEQLEKDIDELATWVGEVHSRRNKGKRPK